MARPVSANQTDEQRAAAAAKRAYRMARPDKVAQEREKRRLLFLQDRACRTCGQVKPLSHFTAHGKGKRHICDPCYAASFVPKIGPRKPYVPSEAARARKRARDAAWQEKNRERNNARILARLKSRPDLMIRGRTARALRRAIRGGKGGESTFALLGYSLAELMRHLERQMLPGMNWKNMGEWHIDHIVPLSSFTITGRDDPELRRAWALTNLRPLWAKENILKSNKRTHLI